MTRGTSRRPRRVPLSFRGMLVLALALMLSTVVYRTPVTAFTLGTSGTGLTLKLTITASGLSGTITAVSVELVEITADFIDDLDLLLIHPNGSNNLVFFSDPTSTSADNFSGSLTISDSGATCVPSNTTGSITAGSTYRPADYGTGEALGNWANLSTEHPALTLTRAGGSGGSACSGAAGTSTFASAFGGLAPNGTWEVWIKDDTGGPPAISMSRIRIVITTTTGSATVATVESFTALPAMDGGVQLAWQTGHEVDNLGFNVYRDDEGQPTRLNPSVIAGSALLVGPGTALAAGRSYVWWDTSGPVTPNTRYWLEDIDLSGRRTWHGPVAIEPSAPAISPPAAHRGQATLLKGLGRGAPRQHLMRPGPWRASLSSLSARASTRQSFLAQGPALKLSVRQPGWYRVTQAELLAAGLDPSIDPRLLQLYVDGREVPILVSGQGDGRLDRGDTVEFLGVGLEDSWSDTRVYWLMAGAQPGRRLTRISPVGGQSAEVSFPYTVERRERSVYFSSLRNGERENFFGAVVSSEPTVETLLVSHLDPAPSTPAELQVALQGVTSGAHRVRVVLNGIGLGEVEFQGQEAGARSFPIDSTLLHAGENQVELSAQAGDSDISLVDTIRLTYRHTYTADHDALQFNAMGQQRLTIGGFTKAGIRVLDITNPDAVREVKAQVQPQGSGFALTFSVPGTEPKTLFAFTPDQAMPITGITANQPSYWRQPGLAAQLVIVSHSDFVASLEPLKTLRQSQGLQVVVVDVEDLYDEFSNGHKTPYAVRDFLSYAAAQWSPAPRYVLFVGKASLDPKNYLGFGDIDLVPTKLIDTQRLETASDDWFVDGDGDGLPELAVGRLPVRTSQEAERLVGKILGYEVNAGGSGVLLVSGVNDGYDFEAASDRLRELLPDDLTTTELKRGQLDPATATNELIAGLNRGPALVNYAGHGSVELWAGKLFTADDVRTLSNGQALSVYIALTCLNGYFHDPALASLGEVLLSAEEGGAVAVWSPSGMTEAGNQAILNQELYRLLFMESAPSDPPLTLGEAARRAKAAVSDNDLRRTGILLGDPSMPLRIR